MSTQELIAEECDRIKRMLLEKNAAYGDSAIAPIRCFSRASNEEQLRVRLDDKLSRLIKGDPTYLDEDVIGDIIGYLILLSITKQQEQIPF